MDFFDVINSRRSVRKYKETTVPDSVINQALDAALVAPNSSNLQPWEFYWVKSEAKKEKLTKACLFQNTAKSAAHLIVAVSRTDTWRRNRDLLIEQMKKDGDIKGIINDYYFKIIPSIYMRDPFGVLSLFRFLIFNFIGLFRPIMRKPIFKKDVFEMVTKTTALACENFMLAITAQGYGTCPMEGFDEKRVKKLLRLNRHSHIVMIISVGEIDPEGIYGPQYRLPRELVVHQV